MENNVVDSKRIGQYLIEIERDEDASNPREDDNLGKMICFHSRYDLGDKHDYDHEDYSGWAEMRKAIEKQEGEGIILPLYLYDHSGITISTTPFGCSWDSGRVGFIHISKKKIREEYSIKRVTDKWITKIAEYLRSEVKTYDDYLTGNVHGYIIYKVDEDDEDEREEVESCWNFVGDSDYCMEEAEGVVKRLIEHDKENVTAPTDVFNKIPTI